MISRSMRGRLPRSTGMLLVPAAAFAVHQLRYTLAYGSRANAELAAQGHSYLHSLVPWLVVALALGLSSFVRRAAHAMRTGEPGAFGRQSLLVLWTITTAGLLAIYAVQESFEEFFASGHPTGLAGIFGHGGWWAVPVAAVVAMIVVGVLRVGRSILGAVARLATRRLTPLDRRPLRRGSVVLVAARPLALSAAGRAPPR